MIKSAVFLLTITVHATPEQMQNDLNNFTYNSSLRQFAPVMANAIQDLDGYGCWCYFYGNHGKGKSQPVDEPDSYCKILHDGYQCVIRDSAAAGIDCVPWETSYRSEIRQICLFFELLADFFL